MYQKFGKRFLDIVLSGCGILVLAPVYLIVALAIKIDDPGPVFFRQKQQEPDYVKKISVFAASLLRNSRKAFIMILVVSTHIHKPKGVPI